VLRLEGLVFCLFGALSQAKAFFCLLKGTQVTAFLVQLLCWWRNSIGVVYKISHSSRKIFACSVWSCIQEQHIRLGTKHWLHLEFLNVYPSVDEDNTVKQYSVAEQILVIWNITVKINSKNKHVSVACNNSQLGKHSWISCSSYWINLTRSLNRKSFISVISEPRTDIGPTVLFFMRLNLTDYVYRKR